MSHIVDAHVAYIKTISDLNQDKAELLERIKRLEEFVEQLTNPKFTRDDLPKEALLQRIKRLEEAGDGLMKSINCGCPYGPSVFNCQTCTNSWDAWRKAKEDKP